MSDCNVCLGPLDGTAEFFDQNVRKARKEYCCAECGIDIHIGDKYVFLSGKYEGEMWSMRVCPICKNVNEVFSCGAGMEFGNLWENMEEAVFPALTVHSPCFHKLSDEARRVVAARWMNWKTR